MEQFEPNSIERESDALWGSGFYETGHTTPPKDYSGVAAVVLVGSILLVSLFSVLGLLRTGLLVNQTEGPQEVIVFSTAPTAFANFRLDQNDTAVASMTEPRSQAVTLGLEGYRVPEVYRRVYRMPDGLYLTDVDTCSDAARQGLQPGDVLLSLDGLAVTDQVSLDSILQKCQPGQTVMARVWRGSQMQDFSLTVEIGG